MKRLVLLPILLFCLVLFIGCAKKDAAEPPHPEQGEKPAQAPQKPEPPKVDAATHATLKMEGLAAKLGEFVSIRRNKPTDFNALKALYESSLKDYVIMVDQEYNTSLDKTVMTAINEGGTGPLAYANAQRAEKSIQRAFILDYMNTLNLLAKSKEGDSTEMLDQRLKTSAPILRSAAQRRSTWTGKGQEYVDNFDSAMQMFQKALGEHNAEKMKLAKGQMDSLVNKVLVLSVFYELGGMEKARGKDENVAAEKKVEAEIYYSSVFDEHNKRDAAAAKSVFEQFKKDPNQIDIDTVRTLLTNQFSTELTGIDPTLLGI